MYKTVGFLLGFFISILLVSVLMIIMSKKLNTDNAAKTKYDERQQLVRGNAYRIAFWSLVVFVIIYAMIDSTNIVLPCVNTVAIFFIIFLAILIHTIYCIFNDGYFGINNKPKSYYILFLIIGLLNLAIGVLNTIEGNLYTDGKLDLPVVNYMAGIVFVILGIAIVIKALISKSKAEEDDEDEEDYA